jgi:EAL domain-containing protein (putative c-di-GMP-specific phosphodiesterase class I)
MLDSPQAEALVHATIELARSLGLRTVAEGVESGAVVQRLTELGCHAVQGYWYSKPVPQAELFEVVRMRKAG